MGEESDGLEDALTAASSARSDFATFARATLSAAARVSRDRT